MVIDSNENPNSSAKIVGLLIQNGANINHIDNKGKTPFSTTTEWGNSEIYQNVSKCKKIYSFRKLGQPSTAF